ncbi:MAG: restriction endonuclease [Planctomycetia bacterium]|nr:restriction endonuclease [Planctomycetia bacterium]
MRAIEFYSHKGGQAFIKQHHQNELDEVIAAIESTDAVKCLRKISKEKRKGLIFHPATLNVAIKTYLHPLGWTEKATSKNSKKGFKEPRITFGQGAFREMDGIKNQVGLEIQFGKYAFMGYDIFSKMPIFAKRKRIECGIEVVAVADLVKEMSTGVSSFKQIILDMGERGVADLDIPTLVVGIGLTDKEEKGCAQKRLRFTANREKMIAAGDVARPGKGSSPGPKGAESIFEEAEKEEEAEEEADSEQI